MTVQPEGTVTFMFTDIEGSTRLLLQVGEGYISVLEKQRRLMREIFATYNGHEEGTEGDSFFVSFSRAIDAVRAASEIQRSLANTEWPGEQEVRVRIGLHTGEPWFDKDRFVGIDIHLAQRISAVGYGGQILLSETTTALIRDKLPDGTTLIDLGRHRLKDIEQPERISQLALQGLPAEYPPLKSVEAVDAAALGITHNLPAERTPFVGREQELAKLDQMLAEPGTRLVTIVGPGGMGKTRLALAAAKKQLQAQEDGPGSFRFPDGIFFIALEETTTEEQLLLGILHALELPTGHGMAPRDQLHNYLKEKCLLLLLDNFEQLVAAAGSITDILAAAPGVKLLVTSREKLALLGEQLFPVQGMAYPEAAIELKQELASFSAPLLFGQRARRIRPDFNLDREGEKELVAICQLVGGMPLALELAAGWVDTLSLGEIVSEIQAGLDFLESDLRDIPERHRSISAVFESTWARLQPEEQRLFAQLSVFRGGFNRQAAEAITGASFRQLASLANRSLLQYDQVHHRYQIHPLLREFGKENLTEDSELDQLTRDRHCRYFCEMIRHWHAGFWDRRQRKHLVEMESDYGNVLLAWGWAINHRLVGMIDAAFDGLYMFNQRSGHSGDNLRICEEAHDLLIGTSNNDEKRVLANIVVNLGGAYADEIDLEYVRQGLSLLDEIEAKGLDVGLEKAWALEREAMLTYKLGSIEQAYDSMLESLRIFQELNEWSRVADVQIVKCWFDRDLGLFKDAENSANESIRLAQATGDWLSLSQAKYRLASSYRARGILESEQKRLESEAAEILKDDVGWYHTLFLRHIGYSHIYRGDYEQADLIYKQALSMAKAAGDTFTYEEFGIYDDISKIYRGLYELVKSNMLAEKMERAVVQGSRGKSLQKWAWLKVVQHQFADASALLEQLIDYYRDRRNREKIGLPLCWRAIALRGLGRVEEAAAQLHQALTLAVETGCIYPVMHGLPAAALLLADLGQKERAVEVYETALQFPHVANAQLFEDVVGVEIKAAAAELPPEVVAGAKKRGKAADPWAVTAALAQQFASK